MGGVTDPIPANPCRTDHQVRRRPDADSDVVTVLCGERHLARRVFPRSRQDLSGEIRHFVSMAMKDHQIEVLRGLLREAAAMLVDAVYDPEDLLERIRLAAS